MTRFKGYGSFGWRSKVPHWHWTWPGGAATFDPSNMNLPRLSWLGEEDDQHVTIILEWGNGNSDPVWGVDQRIRLPRSLASRARY